MVSYSFCVFRSAEGHVSSSGVGATLRPPNRLVFQPAWAPVKLTTSHGENGACIYVVIYAYIYIYMYLYIYRVRVRVNP